MPHYDSEGVFFDEGEAPTAEQVEAVFGPPIFSGTLTDLEAWEAERQRGVYAALRRLLDLRVESSELERWVRSQVSDEDALAAAIDHVTFEWLFALALRP